MALFRNNAENAKRSTSFGSEQPERPHTVGRELNDLREDVESAFAKLEAQTSIPVILSSDLQFKADDQKINAACVIQGANFLAGQTQASVTLDKLTFTSTYPGTAGNSINVTIVKAAGADAGLSVAVANDTDITITLGTAGGDLSDAKNTNTLVIAEFNDKCKNVATAALAAGGAGGDTDVTVTAKTLLSGGTGDGATLRAHDLNAANPVTIPVLTFSDTLINIAADVATLNASLAATDVIGVVLESNRAKSNPFHATTIA